MVGLQAGPEEILVDSRRGRVLKKLIKLLHSARLEAPLGRLRVQSWIVLGVMLVTHIVCYVVITSLITSQYRHVYGVSSKY